MKYINPVKFLTAIAGQPVSIEDPQNLSIARKRIMAEIELSDNQTVEYEGTLYSKNDILVFFDSLGSPEEMRFHSLINGDGELLYFLETGTLKFSRNNRFKKNEHYQAPAFLAFVSPYYESVFTPLVLQCFKARDTRTFVDLMTNPILLTGEYKEKSYARIFRMLGDKMSTLEKINADLESYKDVYTEDVYEAANADITCLLNHLPDEFQEFRVKYGRLLLQMAVGIRKKDNVPMAIEIVQITQQLNAGSDIKQHCENMLKAYHAMETETAKSSSSSGGGSGISFKGIIVIIIVILKLMLLASHCN